MQKRLLGRGVRGCHRVGLRISEGNAFAETTGRSLGHVGVVKMLGTEEKSSREISKSSKSQARDRAGHEPIDSRGEFASAFVHFSGIECVQYFSYGSIFSDFYSAIFVWTFFYQPIK